MWKVGLIGTGYWSTHHLHAWKRIDNVEIKALCNRSPEKLEQSGRSFQIPEQQWYAQLTDMCTHADIDIVDIVTGPETHLELVTIAAKAGKHVMCQKPFATSLEEAEEIVRITKKYGVRLMVTENWRWLQPNQYIKRILDEGSLGKLQVVRYIHTDYYTSRMEPGKPIPQPFFRDMPKLLFYEMGAHWFDTMRFLFGHPKRIYAEILRISPYIVGEDSGTVTLGYDDFYAIMDMSWATRRELEAPVGEVVIPQHREQISIEGDQGTLKLYMDGSISIISTLGIETVMIKHTEWDHAESHYRLQSHYINCLGSGVEFQTSGEDNLRTLELMFAVYHSAKKHEVVHF